MKNNKNPGADTMDCNTQLWVTQKECVAKNIKGLIGNLLK